MTDCYNSRRVGHIFACATLSAATTTIEAELLRLCWAELFRAGSRMKSVVRDSKIFSNTKPSISCTVKTTHQLSASTCFRCTNRGPVVDLSARDILTCAVATGKMSGESSRRSQASKPKRVQVAAACEHCRLLKVKVKFRVSSSKMVLISISSVMEGVHA